MKYVVVIGAGMADEPSAVLGNRTPLDHARTPHLDRLASRGILGLTRSVPRGAATAAHLGLLAALGYDPRAHRAAAAPIEAVGLGVELDPEALALTCDFLTLGAADDGAEVLQPLAAGHPAAAEGRSIAADLRDDLGQDGLELYPGLGGRHVLVWRRGEEGVRTTPPALLVGKPLASGMPNGPGAEALRGIIERSRTLLASHALCQARRDRGERGPTLLWPWGAGRSTTLPAIAPRAGGPGALVAGAPLARGLGTLIGLRAIAAPGATGTLETDLGAKAAAGLAALDDVDLLVVHVEALAEAARRGEPARKVEAIERFDEELIGRLVEGLRGRGEEWRLLVTTDASVSSTTGAPTDDPVPFVAYVSSDEQKAHGASRGFAEREARDQGIFIPEAHTVVERLLRH